MEIRIADQGSCTYRVTIDEGSTASTHIVKVWPSDVEQYGPGSTPEELLEASFEFLLEREPKESILSRFDLAVIERYFPTYPSVVRAKLAARG